MVILWICSSYEDLRQKLKCMKGYNPMCRVSITTVNEIENMSFNSSKWMFFFYLSLEHTKSSW